MILFPFSNAWHHKPMMDGDTCNCELVERLGIPANLLSHHLKALSEAGLVSGRRARVDGRWIYSSVKREAVALWRNRYCEFLGSARIHERTPYGPEGQGAQCSADQPNNRLVDSSFGRPFSCYTRFRPTDNYFTLV